VCQSGKINKPSRISIDSETPCFCLVLLSRATKSSASLKKTARGGAEVAFRSRRGWGAWLPVFRLRGLGFSFPAKFANLAGMGLPSLLH
jgi:hypothetical protein